MQQFIYHLFIFLFLSIIYSSECIDLGRSPVINFWEEINPKYPPQPLNHENQNSLQKITEFILKKKYDVVEKIFDKLLQDIPVHPDVLVKYGKFLEVVDKKNPEKLLFLDAFHNYIFALHQDADHQEAEESYFQILPRVLDHEKKQFTEIDDLVKMFISIELQNNHEALEIFNSIKVRKRYEHIYHTNAIEGNTLPFEITKQILDTGLSPPVPVYIYELNEIWGSLEAFELVNEFAMVSYRNKLEIDINDDTVDGEIDLYLLDYNNHFELLKTLPSQWDNAKTSVPSTKDGNNLDKFSFQKDKHHSSTTRISVQQILQIHKKILGRVMPEEAGRFRKMNISVAGYLPPPAHVVPLLMGKFDQWLRSETVENLHPIEFASLAHFQLTWIHPFQDGNGRTARMLMNLILTSNGYPPALIKVEDRTQYYYVLRLAHETGDTRPFVYFIYQIAYRSIMEYLSELIEFMPSDSLFL